MTTDANNNIVTRNWSQIGDVRIEGVYTGFFQDMSAGLTFGLKLPTGSHGYDLQGVVDRDSELGTGSTDLLFGGFYHGKIGKNSGFGWFAQAILDVPVLVQEDYRPGVELDSALGVAYNGMALGSVSIIPVAQVIASERGHDSGSWAAGGLNAQNPPPQAPNQTNSGYQRILLSPGVEVHLHPFRFYADLEIPVYQHFTGDQLAASWLVKCSMSVMF